MNENLNDISNYLLKIFINHQSEINIIRNFHTKREDWFIVNVLLYLYEIKGKMRISDIDIEIPVDNRGVDLYFIIDNYKYYIEIKHWINKKGGNRPLSSWLSKGGGYIDNDITKLKILKDKSVSNNCFIIIFYTCEDETEESINIALNKFKERVNTEFDIFCESKIYPYPGNNNYIILLEINNNL
jgi:hypothetical protein